MLRADAANASRSASVDIELKGQEGEVVLHVEPSLSQPGVFTCDRVTMRLGPLIGEIETVLDLDVRELRDDFARTLASPTLTGEASVRSLEHDFRVDVQLDHGRGEIRGQVTTQFALQGGLDYRISTDQTFLSRALEQLDALLSSKNS